MQFHSELGEEVDGVFSLADKVDDALVGGLEGATDADVKIALADILGEGHGQLPRVPSALPRPTEERTMTVW